MSGFTRAHPISTDLPPQTRVMLDDITHSHVWTDPALQFYLGGSNAVDFDPGFRALYDGSPTDYFTDGTMPDATFAWAADMRLAMAMIDSAIGTDFSEITDEATARANADFVFVTTQYCDEAGLLGISAFPSEVRRAANDGWAIEIFNSAETFMSTDARLGAGSARFSTLLHEVGHGLGLYHSFQGHAWYSVGGALDNERYTVMSYTRASYDNNQGHAVTMMALDIAALQEQYGVEDYATADSSYRLMNPQGGPLDLSENAVQIGRAYYCIWDSAGVDTIRYSGGRSVLINLNDATLDRGSNQDASEAVAEMKQTAFFSLLTDQIQLEQTDPNYTAGGFFSQVLWTYFGEKTNEQGGFSIAHGVQIEDARGGRGADFLIGNEQANRLYGGGGNDALVGAAGNDSLWGGQGEDELRGGTGDDRLYGGDLTDWIAGGDGFDLIFGGAGQDVLTGGAGDDRFVLNSLAEGDDWITDFSLWDRDMLVIRDATVAISDLVISYVHYDETGNDFIDELVISYAPSGQALWTVVDGADFGWLLVVVNGAMVDLMAYV